ncbi:50S ribosomal protein L5 [candidate division WWE3 bacterium]|nr:50S ribosomal protein L5 [candidate division WWE3 bacterium]
MQNRLYEAYKKEMISKLLKELALSNVMQVPKLKKIVINAGIGSFRDDKSAVEVFTEEIGMITGQRPVLRKARKSEAGFKIRKGDAVGVAVTLRGQRMWAFLDKLIGVVLPRVKDFKGLSVEAFDAQGNYSIGIREHTIFPEVNPNTTRGIRSLQVSLSLSSRVRRHNEALLRKLGLPLKKD